MTEVAAARLSSTVLNTFEVRSVERVAFGDAALRSSARSLAQGVSPGNTMTDSASPGRATERRRISAARSGLQHSVTINLALTRQAKILLPLRGSKCPNSRALRSSARSLAQGVSPGNVSPILPALKGRHRRVISAARSGLGFLAILNLALTRQAKTLLPLRGSRISELPPLGCKSSGLQRHPASAAQWATERPSLLNPRFTQEGPAYPRRTGHVALARLQEEVRYGSTRG